MFNEKDLEQFASKGITPQQVENQLKQFATGFPFLELDSAASGGNGILQPDQTQTAEYISTWKEYKSRKGADGKAAHQITKFVPASGAASRMFKDLFAFLDASYSAPETPFEKKFFAQIKDFAFYGDLNQACMANGGADIDALIAQGNYKTIVSNLLGAEGLNYGALPKGLLKFHSYGADARTPLEEHLAEGALYAADADSNVNLHFTVSPEHHTLFKSLAEQKQGQMSQKFGVTYQISFSEQKPSTDTVAADSNNQPFRNSDGSILFRPGGHGALIENLNDLDSDIVFIKNIDNVVPDALKDPTILNKSLIAGVLVTLQQQAFDYLKILASGSYTRQQLDQTAAFLSDSLYCKGRDTAAMSDSELAGYLKAKLNRPIRVCGMVRNVGEPGGGPFLAYNPDGTISPQILESSQIDMTDARKKAMFTEGTHFNPVDLVCSLKAFDGSKFNLTKYTDPATGFISNKSKSGRELKALELPGLWNGAMSDWNTVFVEVPLETFNPVKTVNDLLRPQHQA